MTRRESGASSILCRIAPNRRHPRCPSAVTRVGDQEHPPPHPQPLSPGGARGVKRTGRKPKRDIRRPGSHFRHLTGCDGRSSFRDRCVPLCGFPGESLRFSVPCRETALMWPRARRARRARQDSTMQAACRSSLQEMRRRAKARGSAVENLGSFPARGKHLMLVRDTAARHSRRPADSPRTMPGLKGRSTNTA